MLSKKYIEQAQQPDWMVEFEKYWKASYRKSACRWMS